MATWTPTATIKAGVTNGKPVIGTGGFGDQTADNLQYLYDRVNQIGLNGLGGIHDDFAANEFDQAVTPGAVDYPYTWELGGSLPSITAANPDHYAQFSQGGGASYSVLAASKYRMRFDLDRDHTLFAEMRHKSAQSDTAEIWLFGFQDESLAVSASTCITTQSNIIGFVQDGTANKYDAICSRSAGSGTLVVANSQGNAVAWSVLRIEITFAGATKKVEFFINGASIGSTTDTNYIPLVRMRPLMGNKGGGGTRIQQIDYCDFDWTVRPLST